jgi:hypothetical protein
MDPMKTTGYPNGGNSPYTGALATQQANATKANQLANIGGKRRKKSRKSKRKLKRTSKKSKRKSKKSRKHKGGSITVPTVQTLYEDKGVGTQSVNGNITTNTAVSAKINEDSKYDSCIGKGPSCI